MTLLATIAVLLRIKARRMKQSSLAAEDWTIIVSLVCTEATTNIER